MRKNALRTPAILIFSIIALYSCVLIPLYQYLITDIVLMDTIWLDIVDLLCQHVEIIGSAVLISFGVFAIFRYRLEGAKSALLLLLGALAFKYVAAVVAVSVEFGSVDLTGGLSGYLVAFLIELAIIALAVFLSHRLITPSQIDYDTQKAASKQLGRPFSKERLYLDSKPLSLKNPIQRILFIGILNIVVWRLAAAVISEFTYGVLLQPGDIPVILIYWILLILLPAFYSYFLARLFFKLCNKCDPAEKEA